MPPNPFSPSVQLFSCFHQFHHTVGHLEEAFSRRVPAGVKPSVLSRMITFSLQNKSPWVYHFAANLSFSKVAVRRSELMLSALSLVVPADGDEKAPSQDRAGVRRSVRPVLVPQPRALHVPLLPLPPDGPVAGPPRHHPAGPGPQLLLLLRQPLRPLPAQRELPPALQQVCRRCVQRGRALCYWFLIMTAFRCDPGVHFTVKVQGGNKRLRESLAAEASTESQLLGLSV